MGVLELAVLGLLKDHDLHGYELKHRLDETIGSIAEVSFGSLYPALARLEAAGALEAVNVRPLPAFPLTGSLGGELAAFRARQMTGRGSRGKKVYRITDRGELVFQELLRTGSSGLLGEPRPSRSADDRLFRVRLLFARHLAGSDRVRLLDERRAALQERAALLAARDAEHTDSYGRAVHHHDRELLDTEVSWLERLAAQERAALHAAAGNARPPLSETGSTRPPTMEQTREETLS